MEEETTNLPSEYATIYPGIVLYNAANMQQSVALDGADVAIKLAMLLDECEGDPSRFDTEQVELFGRKYYLKTVLFGSGNKISRDEETGEFLISFLGSQQGFFDPFLRNGIYRVTTPTASLSQATEESRWIVRPEGVVNLAYPNGYTTQSIRLSAAETSLYLLSDASCRLSIRGVEAAFAESAQYVSDWQGDFCLRSSIVPTDFSFSTLFEATFSLWGEASGSSFYAFNNASTTRFEYRVEATHPINRTPSKTGNLLITDGIEYVRLTTPADYPSESFPSPEVEVERKSNKDFSTIETIVTYQGVSCTL